MKKHLIILFILLTFVIQIYPLFEMNDYNDLALNEKNGTYGFDKYMRKSFAMFYTGVGYSTLADPIDETGYTDFSEVGGRIRMLIQFQELQGFFFVGDMMISRNTLKIADFGDIGWWNSFYPYFGNSHFGYHHKYFQISLGFLNLKSSDAIYNHLMIDDYSGSLFGLRVTSMMGRFFDMELVYSMVRPHQGPWYSGDSTIDINKPDNIKDDREIYDVYYGKSLYIHKINFRPLPWIRIGVYEGAYFLGENINPYYANPFFPYVAAQLMANSFGEKEGSRYNNHALNLLAGIDFNIGFNGWRLYGEFFVDDNNGEYFQFKEGSHPDKFAFTIGGELRGYLFTKYIHISPLGDFILSNFYINFEYGIVSKYTYARDSNFNYEYVRDEYKYRYDPDDPPSSEDVARVNRVGNYLGFMYGPNSDCLDIAIGWRSDLWNVKEYSADYAGDVYFQSLKEKRIPKRLFKIQLHFRQYRLGNERDVIMPYYWNEHPAYDLETGEAKDEPGTSRGTEFLTYVLEIGHLLDLDIYGDLIRLDRFVIGMETKFHWEWRTYNPFTPAQNTDFYYRWEWGLIVSW